MDKGVLLGVAAVIVGALAGGYLYVLYRNVGAAVAVGIVAAGGVVVFW